MPQYTKSVLEEQIKMGEKIPIGLPWRLLLLMLIIFGITVAVYLGMIIGYKPYLNLQIRNLDEKINNLSQAVDEKQQIDFLTFYSQLVNIQELLNSHMAPSKFLDFLEKNTHQDIYYISLNLSTEEKNARLTGVVPDYNVLAQQLELFRRVPEIDRVLLENSQAREKEGGIGFNIKIFFKSELLKTI